MINKLLIAAVTVALFSISLFGQKKTNGSRVIEGTLNYCADAGANDTYACSLDPAIVAYTTGAVYHFKANTANTGAATINLNSIGAKTIKKAQGGITTDLSDNDIQAGQLVIVQYDGTNMQMQSMLGNAPVGVGTVTSVTANSASELSITNTTTTPVISVADAFDISGKTSTAPIKKGTSLPATCDVGMMYFKTDATNTNVLYACTATNTWTAQGTAATYSVDTTVAPVWMWGDPLPGGSNTVISGGGYGICHKFVAKHEIVSTNFGFYVGTASGTCGGTCGFAVRLFDSSKTSIAVTTVATSGGSPNLNTTGWKKTTWASGSAVSTGVLTLQPGVYFECHGTDSTVLAIYDIGNTTWQGIENSEAANSHGYSAGYVSGSGGSLALSTTFPAALTHSGAGATAPYFRFQ